MKTPEPTPDWAEGLPEQGQEDLRRLMQFGGGPFDVEAGLAAFEKRIAKVQPGPASAPRSLLVGALVLSGLAAVAGYAVLRADVPAPPRSTLAPAATASAPARPAEAEITVAVAVPATSIPSVSVDALPTVASAHSRPVPAPAVTTSIAISNETEAGDLVEAEVRHASTLRIVARTDPGRALALATEGDRLFPNGLLHAEREAIAIEALARLGRSSEARARADAFASASPTHPRTGRIRAIARGERPWEP
jgi:hypothetical protein